MANLQWYDWILLVSGVLIIVLVIFATVLAIRANRFTVKEKIGKEKSEKKGKGRLILNLAIVAILIGVAAYLFNYFGGSCSIFKIP